MARRIALVVSAHPDKLSGGRTDTRQIFSLLMDQELGGCSEESPLPVEGCASRAAFHHVWHSVIRNWRSENQLLLYYSGHGSMRNGKFSLVFGASPAEEYLPFDHIASDLQAYGIRRAVLILDACHSGAAGMPGRKSGDSPIGGLERPLPEGIVFVASCSESEYSFEFEDGARGSVFTYLLREAIRTGLGGQATPDNLIGPDDVISYVNKKLTQPEFAKYPQSPCYRVSSADRTVWIARNRSPRENEAARPTARSLEELQFLYERTDHSRKPCPGALTDCLDWTLVRQFARAAGTPVEDGESNELVARRLGFYSSLSASMLHNAAVLCFARAPQQYVHQARSVFVRGRRTGREVHRIDLLGPLSEQVHKLSELVLNEVQRSPSWSSMAPDACELLTRVIREAASNAIVHRDYESNQHAQITVDLPAIEFTNPGRFPRGASFDDILRAGHYSAPRDAAIAWYLTTLLSYEGVGRGFSVFREFRATAGESSLQCREDTTLGSITLTLRLPEFNVCSRCGQSNPEHHRFCNECGAVLAGGHAPSPTLIPSPAVTRTPEPAEPEQARNAAHRKEPLTADDRVGMMLGQGRYVLDSKIGTGGAGTVYVAHDVRTNQEVAIKLLSKRFASSEAQRRFEREATATARIDHPGIVHVMAAGAEYEHMFMVMELVRGLELGAVIRRSDELRLANAGAFFDWCACLVRDIADALHAAHRNGIIHRDIKPNNIMIDPAGRVRVLDFGISRAVEAETNALTITGALLGTPLYMAPEALEGDGTARGPASDIYSLGVVMYELLTGQPSFDATTVAALIQKVVHGRFVRVHERNSRVPQDLAEMCTNLMAVDPRARYKSEEIVQRLDEYLRRQNVNIESREERWAATLAIINA